MRKYFILLFIATVPIILNSCKDSAGADSQNLTRKITFKKEGTLKLLKKDTDSVFASFNIEIADNDYKTQTGLMYRSSMGADEAMLFIFPEAEPRAFYMKNTEIPLDILYFNSDQVLVEFYENAKPYDESSLPSRVPARYVLEINGGQAKMLNIEKGDKFTFERD